METIEMLPPYLRLLFFASLHFCCETGNDSTIHYHLNMIRPFQRDIHFSAETNSFSRAL